MPKQTVQIEKDSIYCKSYNALATSWVGRRFQVNCRIKLRVVEGDKIRNFILPTTFNERKILTKALQSPIPLQSLGIPSHGAFKESNAARVLIRGLKRLKDQRKGADMLHIHRSKVEAHRLQAELGKITHKWQAATGEICIEELSNQLSNLLTVHEESIYLLKKQLKMLQRQAARPTVVLPKNTTTDSGDITAKDLIKDCRVLSGMIDALPETLDLPESAPLRYMLEGETCRLTKLLSDLQKTPEQDCMRQVVEEFIRIEEVLHSDLASSPFLAGQEQALLPFTAKLQELCKSYDAFYT